MFRFLSHPLYISLSVYLLSLFCCSNSVAQVSVKLKPVTAPVTLKSDTYNFWTTDSLTGSWGGYRKYLENDGYKIGGSVIGQLFHNFQGGVHTGSTASSTIDLNLTIDAQKVLGWRGGEFYIDLEDHAGPDPSQQLVGDLQKFTKLNYSPFLQIAELWYQQKFPNNLLRLKIGKIDANAEFSVIDNGLPFLNSSTQVTPTMFTFTTFPDPMLGVNLFYTPNNSYSLNLGAFDANRDDRFLVFSGSPQAAQLSSGGGLYIGEACLKWKHLGKDMHAGNLKLGVWGDTGAFPKLKGGSKQSTDGIYAIVDQTLWRPTSLQNDLRGIRIFMVYGQTPGIDSAIDKQIGSGITWTGIIQGRPNDILGFSPQYVHISDDAGLPKSFELIYEGFYQYQLTPAISIQPDLQYIVNPGGRYSNALVAMMQVQFQL